MRDLRGVLEAVRVIARASQRDAAAPVVFAEVCRVVCESFGFDRSSLARYHQAERELEMVALYGDDSGAIPARLPLAAAPMMAQALESGELLYIADVRSTPAIPAQMVESYGVTSIFVVPLVSDGGCIGFLSADRRGSPFALDELEVDTLETIAVIAATLLEKVTLAEESRRLAGLKDQFISLASHELRTPLAAAYGAIVTVRSRSSELDDATVQKLRDLVYEQVTRATELVEQLLDLSRLDAHALGLQPERLQIDERLAALVALVAGDRAGEVRLDVPDGLAGVLDPVGFDRILSNLLTNALKYGAAPITIAVQRSDRHLRITVDDAGEGVDEPFIPSLFELFSRSERSAHQSGGSGLGLAIARAHAHAHGGEICYQARKPHGARFELVVPQPAIGVEPGPGR